MPRLVSHSDFVDRWWAPLSQELSPAAKVALLDRAFAAVWAQARLTLGEITLTAIVDRVLSTAARSFPLLAQIQVDYTGVSFAQLRQNGSTHLAAVEALRVTLIDLLRVLGSVTGEIVTPSLFAAISTLVAPLPDSESPPAPRPGDEAPTK